MEFKKISKLDAKVKATIASPAGGGKSVGMIKLLNGLISDKSKIAYLNTEKGRLSFYADLIGEGSVIEIDPPFNMQKVSEVIQAAEKAGFKALGIDSLSDFYAGIGGCLDIHGAIAETTKNGFSAWRKAGPMWEKMMTDILSTNLHIVATLKQKTDYVIENVNGKQTVKRVGLAPVVKDGSEYRFVCQFDIDRDTHLATAAKDMTGLFDGKPPFNITEETGLAIRNWCLSK